MNTPISIPAELTTHIIDGANDIGVIGAVARTCRLAASALRVRAVEIARRFVRNDIVGAHAVSRLPNGTLYGTSDIEVVRGLDNQQHHLRVDYEFVDGVIQPTYWRLLPLDGSSCTLYSHDSMLTAVVSKFRTFGPDLTMMFAGEAGNIMFVPNGEASVLINGRLIMVKHDAIAAEDMLLDRPGSNQPQDYIANVNRIVPIIMQVLDKLAKKYKYTLNPIEVRSDAWARDNIRMKTIKINQ